MGKRRTRPPRQAARTIAITVTLVIAGLVAAGPVGLGDEAPQHQEPIQRVASVEEVPSMEGCDSLQAWYDKLLERFPTGTAVPLIRQPSDETLAEIGLPPAAELTEMSFEEPVAFLPDGTTRVVAPSLLAPTEEPTGQGGNGGGSDSGSSDLPLATYAGTGCLGIRPGGWIFNLEGNGISWCTLAHVYGSSGSYEISTAGHCATNGEVLTMVGVLGGEIPVLLDIGKMGNSHDNGIGDDYGLIDVYDDRQSLVSPTMCAWGGPFLGVYEREGILVQGHYNNGQGFSVSTDPDPFLIQGITHFGHGIGIGTGGTPRAGAGASWGPDYFTFVGAIGPGDSGSGANTATTEAAGIITHIIVDPLMRQGVGVAAGTRTTEVGTPVMGLPVGTPAPVLGF